MGIKKYWLFKIGIEYVFIIKYKLIMNSRF